MEKIFFKRILSFWDALFIDKSVSQQRKIYNKQRYLFRIMTGKNKDIYLNHGHHLVMCVNYETISALELTIYPTFEWDKTRANELYGDCMSMTRM
jgi:hypothetical protein